MEQAPVYSVGELTVYIKNRLERDPNLQAVQVQGEVSNLTYHGSGHVYFSLKDNSAQISCVMFRMYAQKAVRMSVGDKMIVTGNMSVYPPRGNYQLMVQAVRKAGLGDLHRRFLQLKSKLEAEGLFDPARKRPIPALPNKIVLITSPTGAAIRDMLQTIKRRYNRGTVLLIPAVVQGEHGVKSIVEAFRAAAKTQADLIILARGGGSLEDLWNFNEEAVARAIADCPIPVISGVGHETDFTIADFVADLRASTPTAAAEHAVPDLASIIFTLDDYEAQLKRNLQYFIDFKRQVLDDYSNRLEQATLQFLQRKRHEVELLATQLKALDIRKLLEQGFSLTLVDGEVRSSAEGIKEGMAIETIFKDGRLESEVKKIQTKPQTDK
ncbi:MAG: exodeoxyribonuclease VII large subunit [Bacteroidota bacterium]